MIGQTLELRLINLIPYRGHSPGIRENVVVATIPPPFEGIRTIQRPQAGVRDGENLRVFSPGP